MYITYSYIQHGNHGATGIQREHCRLHVCENRIKFKKMMLLPPSLPPSSLLPSLTPSLSPSLSHSLPPSLSRSFLPSLTPSLPLSFPLSLPPSFPLSYMYISLTFAQRCCQNVLQFLRIYFIITTSKT